MLGNSKPACGRSTAAQASRVPIGFKAGAWVSAGWSALYLLAAVTILANLESLSSGEGTPFSARSLLLLSVSSLPMSGILGMTCVALRRRWQSARIWILLFWTGLQIQVVLVELSEQGSLELGDFSPTLFLVLSAAYLYLGEDSRAYFQIGRKDQVT